MRILPKNIHKKNRVYKWLTIRDLALLCLLLIVPCILLFKRNFLVGIILLVLVSILFIPTGENCFYEDILSLVKYLVLPKKVVGKEILDKDGVLELSDKTYARVISVKKINLSHMDESEQKEVLSYFERGLKSITQGTTIYILKQDEKLRLSSYSNYLLDKYNENNNQHILSMIDKIDSINSDNTHYTFVYYIILKSKSLKEVEEDTISMCRELEKTGVSCSILPFEESKRVVSGIAFDGDKTVENSEYTIDGHRYAALSLSGFPRDVGYSFGYDIMLRGVNILTKIDRVDKEKSIKRIDRVLSDMEVMTITEHKRSQQIEGEEMCDILSDLLKSLKIGGEVLFDFTVYMYIDLSVVDKKTVKNILSSKGYKIDNMHSHQAELLQESMLLPCAKLDRSRSVSSSVLSAFFPFLSPMLGDSKGGLLGTTDEGPFILDIWKRDRVYQNSNGMVIGRSGSGKSYFLKSMAITEYSLGTKVVILDPENEYSSLVKNLGGKVIDVGSAVDGIINPFEIFPGDDLSPFRYHLKVLENFFRVTLDSLDEISFEYLNSLVVKTYSSFGIGDGTDFTTLTPSSFPVFSDLVREMEKEENTLAIPKDKLDIIRVHLRKFTDGRYTDIWNKHSSFSITDRIVSFNFQSLFMGKNNTVANASMLLIFNFLEGEMVRRSRVEGNEHLLIICDEAHLFIDERYPVSLDFFYQMNKRIRKYGGSFIPATQNISDWMGNEDIRFKTSTIIKNSQYLFVFHLSSPDVKDLRKLYEGVDSFDEEEISSMLSLPTGEMLYISSKEDRGIVKVNPLDSIGGML